MRKSRFSEEQIIGVLGKHEAGMQIADVCRKHGISPATLPGTAIDRVVPYLPSFGPAAAGLRTGNVVSSANTFADGSTVLSSKS